MNKKIFLYTTLPLLLMAFAAIAGIVNHKIQQIPPAPGFTVVATNKTAGDAGLTITATGGDGTTKTSGPVVVPPEYTTFTHYDKPVPGAVFTVATDVTGGSVGCAVIVDGQPPVEATGDGDVMCPGVDGLMKEATGGGPLPHEQARLYWSRAVKVAVALAGLALLAGVFVFRRAK